MSSNRPAPPGATTADGLYAVAAAIDALATAVTRVAYGDVNMPGGLEALGMSIEGPGLAGHNPLSKAITDGFGEVARVIEDAQR